LTGRSTAMIQVGRRSVGTGKVIHRKLSLDSQSERAGARLSASSRPRTPRPAAALANRLSDDALNSSGSVTRPVADLTVSGREQDA
jgi:hypothetical protein